MPLILIRFSKHVARTQNNPV